MRDSAPHAAGCVILRACPEGLRILVIYDQYGQWTFPKGHLEVGESSADAAIREVFEETGIRGELGGLVQTIFYDVFKKDRTLRKQVDFFVMHTTQSTVIPQISEGISDFRWVDTLTAMELVRYDQMKAVLTAALAASV
ncbi:MAG: NUDIX hydrolase [Chloroflexales bacterium]|nr:NUDIX hydrolase [Chloroflexales bacterium]